MCVLCESTFSTMKQVNLKTSLIADVTLVSDLLPRKLGLIMERLCQGILDYKHPTAKGLG